VSREVNSAGDDGCDNPCGHPVLRDPDKILSGHCETARGGAQSVGVPRYVLAVTNPPRTAVVTDARPEVTEDTTISELPVD
jgi:hypothetical protein